jgi:uncharacterized membrane protein
MQVIDLPASAGVAWIKMSFALFRAQPGGWISLVSMWLLLTLGLFFVPLIGAAIATILQPGLFGGFVLAARDQEAGERVGVHKLFDAFRANGRPLVTLGSITLLVEIMLMVLLALMGLPHTISADASGKPDIQAYVNSMEGKEWMVFLAFALVVAIKGALWFSAAILALNQMPATHAIRWSCYALIANIMPMMVFGALMMLIFIIGALPPFLGLLVVTPMYAIAHYVSYRDLFRPSAQT